MFDRPFSEQTRRHFLPLLSSRAWWEETTYELKKLFAVDPDFHPKMFARQMAVIKGQAWNVLQSLKHPDEGPLELTRRVKVLIWDDELDVGESFSAEAIVGPLSAGANPNGFNFYPHPRGSPTRPRRIRSASSPRDFPPPANSRASSDLTGASRPVPFSSKVTRINPSATGVSVLEHLERLDKVEEGLKRLGRGDDILFEAEGEDDHSTAEGAPLINEPVPPLEVLSDPEPQTSTSMDIAASTSQSNTKPRLSGVGNGIRPTPTIRMSEDAPRPSHIRWASHDTAGRSGRSMDVFRRPLQDGSGTKKVISEVSLFML